MSKSYLEKSVETIHRRTRRNSSVDETAANLERTNQNSPYFSIPKNYAAQETRNYEQKIPFIIHQTFKTNLVPKRMHEAADSWKRFNPEYEYRFSDDGDCRAFIAKHFHNALLEAYDLLPDGAFKADLWRYCTLYIYGGVYADIDARCLRPLSKLITREVEFVVPKGIADKHTLFNGFMCSTPGNKILEEVIARSVKILPIKPSSLCYFDIVGPNGLGNVVNHLLAKNEYSLHGSNIECNTANFRIRILGKLKKLKNQVFQVKDHDEIAFYAKYEGYEEDLESLSVPHWKNCKTQ